MRERGGERRSRSSRDPNAEGALALSEPILFGGQAVIEGVMMRGPGAMAVAVRQPGGNVVVRHRVLAPVVGRRRWLRLPVVRGIAVLGESVSLGLQALVFSAEQATGEEELGRGELNLVVAFSLLGAIGLFFILPTLLVQHLGRSVSALDLNFAEGGLRIALLLAYLAAVSRMRDIQRVLAYHGAEHKAIHTIESGQPLTVACARAHSRLHPRCGTSFLFFVVLVSIVVFAPFGWPVLWLRLLVRVMLLPVLAGLGYEVLRGSARRPRSPLVALIVGPGLWLQRLTTREPDDSQIEVALRALAAVLETG